MAHVHRTPHSDFRDPNVPWDDGPPAPRRPPKSNADCKRQIVWPRDKKQKGAHTWSRWKDVLSGKGPDMWVGKQGDDGPHRQQWTHWGYGVFSDRFDNMGYRDKRDNWPDDPNDWCFGRRSTHEKYDFRTRKYKNPDLRDWSDVKWSRTGREPPLYVRGRWATPHYSQRARNMQTPWERLNGLHPFRYTPDTDFWDWYLNELDPNWRPRI